MVAFWLNVKSGHTNSHNTYTLVIKVYNDDKQLYQITWQFIKHPLRMNLFADLNEGQMFSWISKGFE